MYETNREVRRQLDNLKILDIVVKIGEYQLELSLPHETKVD